MKILRPNSIVITVALCLGAVGLVATPSGAADPANTVTGCEGYSDSVVRLYEGAFLRPPEQAGFDYWMVSYTTGAMSLAQIAQFFSGSAELLDLYGELDDGAYIDQIYQNVLGRGPDAEGREFWLGEMAAGMDRGTVLLRFTESPELVATTGTEPPTDGFFGNGLSGVWNCGVDHGDVEAVLEAFVAAIAEKNTTKASMLSAMPIEFQAGLPTLEAGSPGLYIDPAEPDLPMCEPVGDFSRQCDWFLLEDASVTWRLRAIVGAEGIDFDGSGWTGRYIIASYELVRVG